MFNNIFMCNVAFLLYKQSIAPFGFRKFLSLRNSGSKLRVLVNICGGGMEKGDETSEIPKTVRG